MRLYKLGFTSDLAKLSQEKAEAFVLIAQVFDEESEKEMKRKK